MGNPIPSSTSDVDVSDFRIAILGGGISGLASALSIATNCPSIPADNITVYEQATAYGEIGAGVAIGVSAGRVLQRLGVWPEADAISGHRGNVHRSNRTWDTDELIVDAKAAESTTPGEPRQLFVHRAEFLDVLYSAIEKRQCARLQKNKKVVKIEDLGKTVDITFADGSKAWAHLVIGSDGIHSVVRSHFAVRKPIYSGRIAFRGVIPLSAVASDWSYPNWTMSWLARNKHLLVFPMSQDKLLNIVGFVAKDESEIGDLAESWKAECSREAMEKEYAGWNPMVQKIIRALPPVISQWKINDCEPLNQWTHMDGKVALVGDAAHAMVPMQGSGAGLSIEDADVLGMAIRDYIKNPSLGLAKYMTLYQETRISRTREAQITSREAAMIYDLAGPDFEGKMFEECVPVVKSKVEKRMHWIWKGNLEEDYRTTKQAMAMA